MITETSFAGVLEHIHFCAAASADMQACPSARLVAGSGIEGDRYALGTGTYSNRPHSDRQVTLIERETLDALARDVHVVLEPHEHRRNLTTRGVPLNHLVGRYFRVGECVLFGGRLNVPCRYLEERVGRPVFQPLVHRSGLNARVIVGGIISTGDRITPMEASEVPPTMRVNDH
jgi:MOSC domain-containing protein YiiM